MLPEEKARQWIDSKLADAGWQVINRDEYAPGMTAVAIREAPMKGHLEADYLLLINGKAAAIIEAKRNEVALDNPKLIAQAENYTKQLHSWCPAWQLPLPFVYLSNGKAIAFKDCRQADAQYNLVQDFPRPWDLARKLDLGEFAGLPFLSSQKLRKCQYEAISNVEQSFKSGKQRALIALATGAGKTFTACMIAYRFLSYTRAKRVLFLVDRNNLGSNAMLEFQQFKLTEHERPLSEIFGINKLSNRPIDSSTNILISTIQRLYSQLTGKNENYSEEDEDLECGHQEGKVMELPENPALPSDFFDLIIIDECHRSIYSDWKKVLTYFKSARMLGMTATPIPETLAFFDNNLVANYSYEQSVIDGVNVSFRIYRIKTELTSEGGEINVGDQMIVTSRQNKTKQDQIAIEERSFDKGNLNRSIVVRDQIRKVLQEYKDIVFTRLYPEREPNYDYLPKTLIFAVSELHAQLIVEVAKEVFGRSDNKFAQTITYSAGDSNALIRSFRYDVDFRIAVTVTLVATGTDVRPLEVLIFFNDVHSDTLYKQMKGRGCRTISPSQLRTVTPNAQTKDLFYLIDAVGVTESEKCIPAIDNESKRPLNPSLEVLFEKMSLGYIPDDYLHLLASKLATIGNRADPEELLDFAQLSPRTPQGWAQHIMQALEEDKLPPFEDVNDDNTERKQLLEGLLSNVAARKKLVEIAKGYIKELVGKEDTIISSGFSQEEAAAKTYAFETYVNANRDNIDALNFIYHNDISKLSNTVLDKLNSRLDIDLNGFNIGHMWNNYAILHRDKIQHYQSDTKAITDLIQLVRYAYKQTDSLYSLSSIANQRFELWFGQIHRQLPDDKKDLFRNIANYIVQNGACDLQFFWKIDPNSASSLVRTCGNAARANQELATLNDFILKVI